MRVFMLVNTVAEFADWCARSGVHPTAVVCVTDPGSLRGKMQRCDQLIDARLPPPLSLQPPSARAHLNS